MLLRKISSLLMLFPFIFFAQENVFHHYGIEQGLSQETVQCIIKDKTGYIWIGTQEGLNRFDGTSFKVFKNDIEATNTLCGNDVKKLLEFDNYIFIGSKNNGICYYDKSLNTFFRTSITKGTCTGLIKFKNAIYASILNEGLFKIEYKKGTLITTNITSILPKNISSLYGFNDTIYIGTNSGLMYYATLKNDSYKEIKIVEKTGRINSFFYDNKFLWVGTNVGLYKYDLIKNKTEFVNLKLYDNSITNKIGINKIFVYKNDYYIATDNGLILLTYNINKHDFDNYQVFKGDINNINSITSNRVYDILHFDDMLWIGTNKLDVLTLEKSVFNSINSKSKPALNNNHVYAILKTNEYLFIGTRNGLNCIDKNNKTTIISKENTNNNLAYNVIRGLTIDNNNNLWIATTKGISILNLTNFNPKKPKLKSIYHDSTDPTSLSSNVIRTIFLDKKNNVWIATYGGGINLFVGDLSTNDIRFKHYKSVPNKESLISNFTFSINQTSDDAYWVCTENGFNKIVFKDHNFQNPTYTNYFKDLKTTNALKSNSVLTTLIDSENKNVLWIGTDNGLHKFDILKDSFKYYGVKNGLTNTVVYSILEDVSKDLWLSTNDGIFKFNKTKEHFINYTVNDGLTNTEFNLGAKFNDTQNQQLYFGGTKGVNYFNIDNLDKLYREGDLIFTSLTVKGQEISPTNNGMINTNIDKAKTIHLEHSDFPTRLSFADLNYDFPKSSHFVYKLLPKDKNWNNLNELKEIQFLDLNTGSYELQIQGKGKEKLWSKNSLKIKIIVSPPWYKSYLAYFIYALLFLSVIYYLYKTQLQRSLEQKETVRLKELNELKSKLYSNITHEFRTPLTVILGMTDSLKDNIKNATDKTDNYLEMIKRNSNNLLQLVNQILDLAKAEQGKIKLKLESDNIVKHIKYLTESYASYADEKNISLIFYNEISNLKMNFDKDKINKIISNLISNAIKFSKENDKIIVFLKLEDSNLILEVKDTGLGITKDNLPFIFDRFYQADNNTDKNSGTGIGLSLTKELVQLMNGKIEVKSIVNVATTFTISLPIDNEILNDFNGDEHDDEKNQTIAISDKPIALIVEDNKDVRTYIKICIENRYQILLAKNGKEGIEMALEHTPDIIISDVMMPLVDGFELCKTLKEDVKTNHIPIIILTAKNSQESKIEGLSYGADAYLTKPFNKEELLIRIKKLIGIRELLQGKYKDLSQIVIKKNTTDINDIFIQKAIVLINNHIDNSEYNSKQLSEDLFLSESQLYRKLKALSTYSTAIFIRKIRLQTAKKLLETTSKSVSEICYETGFNEPSWFSKVFKKEFGFSPNNER